MEGAIEIRGITRSAFLARSALAAGGLYGAGAVAPLVDRALAQSGGGDIAILNFALTLERVESAFYKAALTHPAVAADLKDLVKEIAGHEAAHVAQLTQTIQQLGATPAPAPKITLPALGGRGPLLRAAIALEETGVGAYNGAAPRIVSKDVLLAAGSIVQVEARHAGALRLLAGQDPAPAAFDRALSQHEALVPGKPFAKP